LEVSAQVELTFLESPVPRDLPWVKLALQLKEDDGDD
jgi:hypothetical protein